MDVFATAISRTAINFATCDWPAILDRRVGRDLSSEEAHALAARSTTTLTLAARDVRPDRDPRAPRGARHPLRGRAAVGQRDQHRSRLSAGGHLGVALETFEPVVVTASPLDDSPRGPPCRRSHERLRGGSRRGARPLRDERRAPRRGQAAGNLILTRDAADHVPDLQPIRERFGWSWGCFVEMPVERGIAQALGMAPVDAPRLGPDGIRSCGRGGLCRVGASGRRGPRGLPGAVCPYQGTRRAGP